MVPLPAQIGRNTKREAAITDDDRGIMAGMSPTTAWRHADASQSSSERAARFTDTHDRRVLTMPVLESDTASGALSSYNGVLFEVYSSDAKGKPIYDEARRTITCVEWEITINAYIWSSTVGVTNDANMQSRGPSS